MNRSVRTILLGSVSSVAMVTIAAAADMSMPAKAPYAPPPISNWQGFYIGANAGAARVNNNQNYTSNTDNDPGVCMGSSSCSISATGAIAGGQIGYNWQYKYWVVGVEADGDWTGLSHTVTTTVGTLATLNTRVDWLASVRGRMGLAVDDTMVYFTGGVGFAGTKSGWGAGYTGTPNVACGGGCSGTEAGWVGGFGVEHMLSAHWLVRGEALYYSFGNDTKTVTTAGGNTYTTQFQHEVISTRLGISYKW